MFILNYLGYGELFGPMQLTSSVNAFPDKYLSFVSLVHRSVDANVGHTFDFDLTDGCTNDARHIVKIVYAVKIYFEKKKFANKNYNLFQWS